MRRRQTHFEYDIPADYDLIETLNNDRLADHVHDLIVNRWGINLVAVDHIVVNRQPDGQLTDLHVKFIPAKKRR